MFHSEHESATMSYSTKRLIKPPSRKLGSLQDSRQQKREKEGDTQKTYKNITHLFSEKLEAFPLIPRTVQGCSPTTLQHCTGGPGYYHKKRKSIHILKKRK